ncbi:MAG: class I SAM-dependent methyltransferase [Candidatus Omnitrophica bacterium]|nr:class I SAM-dependent methyltransferase [Candidatus Omnitrophota bacterium]
MPNYERYKKKPRISALEDRISCLIWKGPSDKVILPFIGGIHGMKVCDVGCGPGAYARIFLEQGNSVTGVDKNPGRCAVPITVYNEDAADFAHCLDSACDVVFSAWLTEYLDGEQLEKFFCQAYQALKPGGTFITTVIRTRGWGWLYVTMARRFRGIRKYYYPQALVSDTLSKAQFTSVRVLTLPGALGLPWAELYSAQKL